MNTRSKLVFASLLSLCLILALTSGMVSKTNEDREVARLEGERNIFVPEATEAELSILRGLKGVFVSVDKLFKDTNEAGLTEKDILKLVQSQLQKEGVKIFSREEYLKAAGRPNLFIVVKVNTDKESDLCAVNITLQLREDVFLERESGGHLSGCVSWQMNRLGLCRRAELGERIKNNVTKCAERFAQEFVSANSATAEKRRREEPMISGTVRYQEIEGGFYGLVADDGRKYDPINLPAEYKKNGLRVKFTVREKKDVMSFHMWGKIVEVVKIEKAVE